MTTRALFSYITRVENGAITIRDIGHLLKDGTAISVTNDAEAVVAEVVRTHGNVRIFYFNTMGNRDELLHSNGVFKGFAFCTGGNMTQLFYVRLVITCRSGYSVAADWSDEAISKSDDQLNELKALFRNMSELTHLRVTVTRPEVGETDVFFHPDDISNVSFEYKAA